MPIQTKADLYRMQVDEWERTASQDARIDRRGFPPTLSCWAKGEEIAFVDEDGDVRLNVSWLDKGQADALRGFLADVFGAADCHAIQGRER